MRNILLATTGENHCRSAEDYAVSYCARTGAILGVIYATDSDLAHYGQVDPLATEGDRRDFITHASWQETEHAQERLERICAKAQSLNVDYELYIERKAPLYCIVQRAKENNPELLVVGGRRSRYNPFSLVRSLARKAPCEVRQIQSQ
ncbi:MAG: universal stress protein [Desulfovibrionaceae bacterium]|nr:universal stress protein [Desulfovibrionaceae bacterium]